MTTTTTTTISRRQRRQLIGEWVQLLPLAFAYLLTDLLYYSSSSNSVEAAASADPVVLVNRSEQFTVKENGGFRLEVDDSSGNVILTETSTGDLLWESGGDDTDLSDNYFGILQGDCHFISRRGSDGIVWRSRTSIDPNPGCFIGVSLIEGYLAIYKDDGSGETYWSSPLLDPTTGSGSLVTLLQRNTHIELQTPVLVGGFKLELESDGNLVLSIVSTGEVAWETGVSGSGTNFYGTFQGDCNLVLWSENRHGDSGTTPSRTLLWKSSSRSPGTDCSLVVSDGSMIAITGTDWEEPLSTSTPPTGSSIEILMERDAQILSGNSIQSGDYELELLSNGNLVLNKVSTNKLLWQTGSIGEEALSYFTVLQGDCNLIIWQRDPNGSDALTLHWKSRTIVDRATCRLAALPEEELLVIYDGTADYVQTRHWERSISETQSIFCVIADVPYNTQEEQALEVQMDTVPGVCEWIVHLGDIQRGRTDCTVEKFNQTADIFRRSHVPMFVVLGDNEWNDCPAGTEDDGWDAWNEIFFRFDEDGKSSWNHGLSVAECPLHPENMYWVQKRTLFFALNVVGGAVYPDRSTWVQYHIDIVSWIGSVIQEVVLNRSEASGIVLMAHAQVSGNHVNFFDGLRDHVRDVLGNAYPTLYLHGDGHAWLHNLDFRGQSSFVEIQTSGGTVDPVLVMQVDPHKYTDNPGAAFQYDRDFDYGR